MSLTLFRPLVADPMGRVEGSSGQIIGSPHRDEDECWSK